MELNSEQRRASMFDGKHLLVLAGAGTGKTRTIIARAKFLIDQGVSPRKIKILSFTKKSAREIVERIKIESSSNSDLRDLSGSTFHSWCMEIMKSHPNIFKSANYTCLDEDDRENAFGLIMGDVIGKKTLKITDSFRLKPDQLVEVYSYAINVRTNLKRAINIKLYSNDDDRDLGLEREQEVNHIVSILGEIIQKYISYKRSRQYIDYDDMLSMVAHTLKSNETIRNIISSEYEHILVDEMQDTNPLQWELLESFFENCCLFCVGDDAQSIYSFRGADFKSIHSFTEKVSNSTIYKLERNYRSIQEILDLSNWLLSVSPLKYGKELIADRGKGNKPSIIYVDNEWEEADFITNTILKNIKESKDYKDHLVLSRSVFGLRRIEGACISKKIPYKIFGGTSLMQSAHIRDVVSAMRIIANIYDELAWFRYLKLWDGVGEIKATKLIREIINLNNIDECIEYLSKTKLINDPNHHGVLSEIKNLNNNPAEAITILCKALEKVLEKKYDNWKHRKEDFEPLKMVARSSRNIVEFVNEYIIDPQIETTIKIQSETSKDYVILSTIHSAKGLEADVCFVVNVSPRSFPSPRAKTDDEIEEERRCLYVALTRAKNELYITRMTSSVRVDYSDLSKLSVRVKIRSKHSSFENGLEKYKEGEIVKVEDILVDEVKSTPGDDLNSEIINQKKSVKLISFSTDNDLIESCISNIFLESYELVDGDQFASQKYFLNNLPHDLVNHVNLNKFGGVKLEEKNNFSTNEDMLEITDKELFEMLGIDSAKDNLSDDETNKFIYPPKDL